MPSLFIEKVMMSLVVVLEYVQDSLSTRRGWTRKRGDTGRQRDWVELFE